MTKRYVRSATERPGFQTTEFWIIVFTNLALVVGAVSDQLSPRYAAIAIAVANAAYAIARGLAKGSGS